MRIGIGYDVHKLVNDRKLILGGVEIPNNLGLLGHSDADVLLHAISDALLGAAALGDIGRHFPDNDIKYKDISSIIILKRVCELISEKGYKPVNIDATIVAQSPKISPYVLNMRKNIAECLEIDINSINIKATTTEELGFEGRKEGISSHCVCLLTEDV